MKLSRKIAAFQTPVPVTPLEMAVRSTELQLQFGCSINGTENICNNTRIACYIVTIDIYSLSQQFCQSVRFLAYYERNESLHKRSSTIYQRQSRVPPE